MSGKLLYYHFYSLGALNKKTLRDAHEQILTWPALIYRSLHLTYRDLHFSASTCITQITPTTQHRIYNGQSLIALNPVTQQLYYRTDENTVRCRVIDEESSADFKHNHDTYPLITWRITIDQKDQLINGHLKISAIAEYKPDFTHIQSLSFQQTNTPTDCSTQADKAHRTSPRLKKNDSQVTKIRTFLKRSSQIMTHIQNTQRINQSTFVADIPPREKAKQSGSKMNFEKPYKYAKQIWALYFRYPILLSQAFQPLTMALSQYCSQLAKTVGIYLLCLAALVFAIAIGLQSAIYFFPLWYRSTRIAAIGMRKPFYACTLWCAKTRSTLIVQDFIAVKPIHVGMISRLNTTIF